MSAFYADIYRVFVESLGSSTEHPDPKCVAYALYPIYKLARSLRVLYFAVSAGIKSDNGKLVGRATESQTYSSFA